MKNYYKVPKNEASWLKEAREKEEAKIKKYGLLGEKNKSIIIKVSFGVASVVQTCKGITVTIKDHDHKVVMKNIDGQNLPSTPLK